MITADTLRKFAPRIENAELHAEVLEKARKESSVNTAPGYVTSWGRFSLRPGASRALEENLNYKNPERLDMVFKAVKGTADAKALIAKGPQAIANRVYANRLGNGNEASGDGWRLHESGYKQLTGRANFRAIGALVRMDLEGHRSSLASRRTRRAWLSPSGMLANAPRWRTRATWTRSPRK